MRRRAGGSGLGLSIAKSLAELHGGALTAHSSAGSTMGEVQPHLVPYADRVIADTTGDLVSSSFMFPRTHEELVKKRQTFKLRTDHNFGFMGRAPDFMNAFVTNWHLTADRFARPVKLSAGRKRHALVLPG